MDLHNYLQSADTYLILDVVVFIVFIKYSDNVYTICNTNKMLID